MEWSYWRSYYGKAIGVVVDFIHAADMDEAYGTYAADEECFDNHDYDDDTDDDIYIIV